MKTRKKTSTKDTSSALRRARKTITDNIAAIDRESSGSRKRPKAAEGKKLSCLSAAAVVLADGRERTAAEIIQEMAVRGLWSSPRGKTPHATLYSAMIREIARRSPKESRFAHPSPGKFRCA